MKKILFAMALAISSQVCMADMDVPWIVFKGIQAQEAYNSLTDIQEVTAPGKTVVRNASNISCSRATDATLIDAYQCSIKLSIQSSSATLLEAK